MADAADSKSADGNIVRVQVPPSALNLIIKPLEICMFQGVFVFYYNEKMAVKRQKHKYTCFSIFPVISFSKK
jgi:hypothetical protein